MNTCAPLQQAKRKQLKEQINIEEEKIDDRMTYRQSELLRYGYADDKALHDAKQEQEQSKEYIQSQKIQIKKLQKDYSVMEAEYKDTLSSVPEAFRNSLKHESHIQMDPEYRPSIDAVKSFLNQNTPQEKPTVTGRDTSRKNHRIR